MPIVSPFGLTLREAGERLGLDPATLRSQLRNGRLRGRRVGTMWFIAPREVERYARESKGKPGRPKH